MDDDRVPTLDEVIGRATRTLRKQRYMAQDALARACQRKGLTWSRSSIAMLEAGRRSCNISELLIVASALGAPLRLIVSGECLPDRPDEVMLTTTTAASLRAISEALVSRADHLGEGTADKIGRELGDREKSGPLDLTPILHIDSGDADQKAARRLGIRTDELMSVAKSLWGRSLTAERDRRVDAGVPTSADDQHLMVADDRPVLASPEGQQRALRALRGHTTRELLRELRAAFDRAEED